MIDQKSYPQPESKSTHGAHRMLQDVKEVKTAPTGRPKVPAMLLPASPPASFPLGGITGV
jgi:hypothetical protein